MTQYLVLALLVLGTLGAKKQITLGDTILTDKPVIGVFAYPSEFEGTYPSSDYNYVASSYIKWVEQAGARAMPIPFDLTEAELTEMFYMVNGLVFPGGFWNVFDEQESEIGFQQHTKAAIHLLKLAKQTNDNGQYFPVYGIQSGMLLIAAALGADGTGENKLFDSSFKVQNLAGNLQFMRNATDSMWSFQQKQTIDFAAGNNAVLFYSNYTLSIVKFLRNDKLRADFDITAMSKDSNGQQFVSAFEAKNYPIFGTFFFSQGNSFEWKNTLHLSHHPRSVDFQQQLSNFFVQYSRQNGHSYDLGDDEDNLLIYNFQTTKIHNDYFENIYFFHKAEFKQRLAVAREKIFLKKQLKNLQEQRFAQ